MPLDILAPSTILHMGGKFLQMAATNNTTGHHKNTHFSVVQSKMLVCSSTEHDVGTEWHLYWTLVQQHSAEVKARLKESAKDAPNKGSIFRFEQFRTLLTKEYNRESGMPFPVWVNKRFLALSVLLGALRSEQLNRFREGGLSSIEWIKDNRGRDHF